MQRVETTQDRLEDQLRARYPHLQHVHVVSAGKIKTDVQYAELVRQWGVAAAGYFDRLAEDAEQVGTHLHVGVSGGETILEVMSQLPERERPHVHFHTIALIGRGLLKTSTHVGPETNATIAWARYGRIPGHCHYATVSPYFLENLKEKNMTPEQRRKEIAVQLRDLAENEAIKKFIMHIDHVAPHVVFAGLGVVNPSGTNPGYSASQVDRLAMTGLLKPLGITAAELTAEGAIGDLCYCLFNAEAEGEPKNAQGRKLAKEYWRFFLTAGHYNPEEQGLEFYRKMVANKANNQTVIVIAGTQKDAVIRAGLKGKFFNVWFTDEETARNILES
jgi:Putative sugar-binding domain